MLGLHQRLGNYCTGNLANSSVHVMLFRLYAPTEGILKSHLQILCELSRSNAKFLKGAVELKRTQEYLSSAVQVKPFSDTLFFSEQAAFSAGYDCVEVDVVLSADGVPVVCHVRDLQALLELSGDRRSGIQAGDLALQEISALRWESGDGVETARDVIEAVRDHVRTVILDVKTYNGPDGSPTDEAAVSEAVVELVRDTACINCLVWAKSDRIVERVKRLLPGQQVGYVVMNETRAARELGLHLPLRLGSAEVVAVHHEMVDGDLLAELRGAGKLVHGWTANEPRMMRHLLESGVDAIVTSHPQRRVTSLSLECDFTFHKFFAPFPP